MVTFIVIIMDMKFHLIVSIVFAASLFHKGFSTIDYADVKSDYEALLSAYQTDNSVTLREVIPKDSLASPINVKLGMDLYAVMNFDAVQGEITLIGALNVEWQDDVKTLTGTTFTGTLESILVDYDNIWNPNLVIMNDAKSVQKIGDTAYKVRYNTSSGYCQWKPRLIINAACTPDTTFYPFDEQNCTLTITPWFRDESKIVLTTSTDTWNTEDMIESGIWTVSLTSSTSYISDNKPFVDFTIVIKRKPLFLTIVIVFPVLLLSLLTGFLFLLPPGSGERSGFGITCFLSFVVVLQVLMQFLPETSVRMSVLCYYIICMLTFSAGLSIVNILILRMYLSPGSGKIPTWLLYLVKVARCIPCRLCYRRCQCRRKLKACCRRCCGKIAQACRYCRKKMCVCWKKYGNCRCICHEEKVKSHDVNTNMKFKFGQFQRQSKDESSVGLHSCDGGLRVRASGKLSRVSPLKRRMTWASKENGRTAYNAAFLEKDRLNMSTMVEAQEDNADCSVSSLNTSTTVLSVSNDSGKSSNSATSGYGYGKGIEDTLHDDDIHKVNNADITVVSDDEENDFDHVDYIDEVENTPAFLAALTWELIAKILDVFFIIVFVAVQIVFTMFFLIPLGARY